MPRAGTSNSRPDAGHAVDPGWAVRAAPAQRRSYRYLLDLDADLADELDVRMRLAARSSVTALTCEAETGPLGLGEWLAAATPGPGLLVLDGVIAATVGVGDRITAELIGAGDLIQPCEDEEAELACELGWRALAPARFAVLDPGFVKRVQPWPQIGAALLRRAARRTRRLDVQRAIAAQPRLEVRLALIMWHLAARWGRVEPGGVRLCLPLTHQLLGRLISAERPSVSHALARLAHAGLISGHGDDWHLHGSVERHLTTMIEPQVSRVEDLPRSFAVPARPR
jgi:CRP/FNR family transcriptional regulator, cyclic AMP receptor protein